MALARSGSNLLRVAGGGGVISVGADSEEIYDLYATDSNSRGTIPFAVNWPTAPTTSTNLNVTNNTNLATALATPNAVITVAAGSYNPLALESDDQHWILDDAAEFSGFTTTSNPTRIKIEGGVVTLGVNYLQMTDVLLDNVRLIGGLVLGHATANLPCVRVSFVHCTWDPTTEFSIISRGNLGEGTVADPSTDIFVLGCYMDSQGGSGIGPVRAQGIHRFLFIDNRVRAGTNGSVDSGRCLRSHYGCSDYWVRRVLEEYGDGIYLRPRGDGADGDETPDDYMGDHWFYDYTIYNPSGNPNGGVYHAARFGSNATTFPGVLTVAGCAAYDYRGPQADDALWAWSAKAGDSVAPCPEYAYQAPPAMGSWLTARGIQPGADH
jgi:hypothetical protein